jgi:nucleotide-binding universal stress UspA family protein
MSHTEQDSRASRRFIVEYGPPAERVLAVAEEFAMDLIVLGVKRTPVHFDHRRTFRSPQRTRL